MNGQTRTFPEDTVMVDSHGGLWLPHRGHNALTQNIGPTGYAMPMELSGRAARMAASAGNSPYARLRALGGKDVYVGEFHYVTVPAGIRCVPSV